MEIKFLKAGKGDSILIKSEGENALIDGGDNIRFLLREVDKIYNDNQGLDYLIITHHDSDHIKGIIDLLKEVKEKRYGKPSDFIKRVYFNSPRLIKGIPIPEDSNFLSYKQASDIEKLITSLGLTWDSTLLDISDSFTVGNVRLKCLSPTLEIADGYAGAKGAFLSSEKRSDWDKNLAYLEKYISDKSLDNTIPNLSSIVLKIEANGKQGLLTGDITPKRFDTILNGLYEQNDNRILDFEFIKLPHHGSHRNLTAGILSKISCENYIICTDGNNHFLPDKKALLKVINFNENKGSDINFLFNYKETIEKLRISLNEKKKYKFELIPNNTDNGFCLSTI